MKSKSHLSNFLFRVVCLKKVYRTNYLIKYVTEEDIKLRIDSARFNIKNNSRRREANCPKCELKSIQFSLIAIHCYWKKRKKIF